MKVRYVSGTEIEYAPKSLDGYSPVPDSVYAAHGYYDLRDVRPDTADGQHLELDRYEQGDGEVVAYYTAVDDPPAVRTYSRLKLYAALSSLNLWEPLVAWMQTQTVDGVNVWTAFNLANELSDDHPLFAGYLHRAQEALGLTDAQVSAILEGCRND